MERQFKYDWLEDISLYDLEGTVDQAIEYLQDLKAKYPDKDLQLDYYSDPYPDSSPYLKVVHKRQESDEEYNERVEYYKSIRENRRKQYLALKKEFEGESQ